MLILFVEYHASFRQSATYMMDQEAALVDIPLPDEGAPELVRELHDANPAVPVLVLTRAEDPDVRAEFLAAGASEVLSKECTFVQILAAVRRLRSEV